MSKEQFPLIKRCFPKLELLKVNGLWRFIINAEDLEHQLEKAVRVYGSTQSLSDGSFHLPFSNKKHGDDVQTALLIGIEFIPKDTAESLLRELVDAGPVKKEILWEIQDRARKLLEQK